jgi:hypothetical protein
MNLKTKTIIDYSLFRKFYIFKKVRSKTFVFFSWLNIVVTLTIIGATYFNFISTLPFIVLLVVQSIIISIYLIFNYYRLQSSYNYEANKIGQSISYHFLEDYFRVVYDNEKSKNYVIVKYEDLKEVHEFSNYFFITTLRGVTYIILKGVYDGGDDLVLADFLKKIIGLKFKKIRLI